MITTTTFWVAVAFFGFFILLWKKIKVATVTTLDGYITKVKDEISEAQQLKTEAQNVLADLQRKHRQVLQDSEDILKQASHEAAHLKKLFQHDALEMMKRIEDTIQIKLEQIQIKAVEEVKETTFAISVEAAEKLMFKNLSEADHRKLVDDSISLLASKLN